MMRRIAATAGGAVVAAVAWRQRKKQVAADGISSDSHQRIQGAPLLRWAGPIADPSEPRFTRAEVAVHDGSDGKPMWVTYRNGVYDVTQFQHEHPGGDYIVQAAGGAVDGFWQFWAYHHLSDKAAQYLNELRIGVLSDWGPSDDALDDGGLYADEPVHRRGSGQVVMTSQPYCSETNNATLAASYLTPVDEHYVRNHSPVPSISPEDAADFELSIYDSRSVSEPKEVLSLPLPLWLELFKPATITSVVQCSGNRGGENIKHHGAESGFFGTVFDNIGIGMVGNAQWTGPRLADVLTVLFPEISKMSADEQAKLHVQFDGADGYACSTPLSVIINRENDCVLATKMNGELLPPDHGFPVRVILPGVAGARNVKWVSRISIRDSECSAPWNSKYYKVGENDSKKSAQEMPLQSLILKPEPATALLPYDTIEISGVAYSGGSGNRINMVEVSADRGASWVLADVAYHEIPEDDSSKSHGWVRWKACVTVPGESGSFLCRATDSEGITQPLVSKCNGGYFYNGCHEVTFQVQRAPDVETVDK